MNELSIEDKAKRYDEAIKKGKQILNNPYTARWDIMKEVAEHLLPELKEGEDGRIIRWIRKELEAKYLTGNEVDDVIADKAFAWLKKQGEHANFRNKIQIGDKVTRNEDGVLVNLSQLNRVAKKQGEQDDFTKKELECIKVYRDRAIQRLKELKEQILANSAKTCKDEQNLPAWSEEDEMMLECVLDKIGDLDTGEMCKDWLKNLKDRLQLQNLIVTKEELAQAKNDAYNEALDKIEYHSEKPTFDDGWSAAIWYIKKRNAQPQTAWKPSDEQMKALDAVVADAKYKNDISTSGHEPYTHLYTLLQDLKKL